jgi:hypothetical protein
VDFLKYITAVVAAKKAETDLEHERIDQRSSLLKNLMLFPFTLGIPLLRDLFVGRKRPSA